MLLNFGSSPEDVCFSYVYGLIICLGFLGTREKCSNMLQKNTDARVVNFLMQWDLGKGLKHWNILDSSTTYNAYKAENITCQ